MNRIANKFLATIGLAIAVGVFSAPGALAQQEEEEPILMRPNPVDDAMMGGPTGPGDDVSKLPSPGDVIQKNRTDLVSGKRIYRPNPEGDGGGKQIVAPTNVKGLVAPTNVKGLVAPTNVKGIITPTDIKGAKISPSN